MKLISTGIAALCTMASTAALAQSAEPPAPQDSAQESGALEEIVVTATRRAEPLQKIPLTVTAITGDALKSGGVIETRQLTQMVPGLVGSRNAGVNQPVIRGVGSSGVVGDEANVATYVDSIYQPDPWTTNLDLVEVQRIEVLRGPQGTLFGRNATGGLINVITPDPGFDPRGHMNVSYGRLRGANEYDVRGYVTGGLSDTVAMDFSGLYKKNENYIDDIVRGGKRFGEDEYHAFRSKLLFKPSDDAQVTLTGDYAKRDGGSNVNELYQNDTVGRRYPGVILPTGPWQASLSYGPMLNTEKYGASLQTKFDLGWASFETATAYQHGEVAQFQDQDSSNIDLGRGEAYTTQRTFSQEVRLLSNSDGRLQWLTGLYYYWSHLDGVVPTTTPGSVPPPTLPPLSTRFSEPDVRVAPSVAGFAEGTYELVDTLFLTLGARYTTETRKFEQVINGAALFPPQRTTFDKFTYRGAIRWQFNPDANVYLNYGTGFKSGIYNGVGTSPVPTKPENLRSIEGGIKADPTRWFRANLSVFDYDYTDLQVSARDPASNLYVLQNAATAKVYGSELELTLVPTSDLSLRGSFAYTHGEYTTFTLAQGFVANANGGNTAVVSDVSGNEMIRTPRTTFNLGADWAHEYAFGQLGASFNWYHSARVYYDFTNNFSQKPYSLVNAELFLMPTGERWRFSVAATNLTNERVFQALRVGTSSTDGILERPREIKAALRYNF